jgi:putative transposase
MQHPKSMTSAQRFLSAFSRFWNHFRLRRHLLKASEYRSTLQARFHSWREVADMCPVAA